MLQQLAHLMVARHLISLIWLEKTYCDDDDDVGRGLQVCEGGMVYN